MITVYTKPSCVGCDAAKRLLTSLGVEYETKGPEEAIELGYRSVPVITKGDKIVIGFNYDAIKELALNDDV